MNQILSPYDRYGTVKSFASSVHFKRIFQTFSTS